MGDTSIKGVSRYILVDFYYLSLSGTMLLFVFSRLVAHQGSSDLKRVMRSINQVDLGPHYHLQDMCLNHDLSKILQPQ